MKAGALFAGYGGLELAVSDVLDVEPAWVAEFDAAPSRILAQRFPDVPNLGDVTKVDWASLEPVDIITGGSPCQDLSHAGKRAGMRAGTRSGLWASMCDAIETIRPRLVVWENVRGALSAEADSAVEPCPICVGDGDGVTLRALGRVLGDLAELGYDAAWTGVRAADVGAPHGRFRVFVLAWPADTAGDPRWLGDGDGGAAAGLGGRAAGLTLLPSPRTSDTNGAGVHGSGGMDLRTAVSLLPTPTTEPTTGNGHARNLGTEARMLPMPQAMDTAGAMDDRRSTSGYGPALRDITALLPTPRATDGTKGGPNQRGSSGDLMLPSAVTLLPTPSVADVEGGRKHRSGARSGELLLNGLAHAQAFGQYAPAIARWESVLGRPAPAPTEQDWERWEKARRRRISSRLPAGMRGSIRFIVDGPPRRLSPRFVEWLMGLPDGWVTDTDTTRNEQLKALGNGVVPQQAAAALRHLLAVREWAMTGKAVAA